MKKIFLFGMLLTALSSCAHVISPENRENALSAVSLADLRAHPEQFTEKTFIYGGVIADTFITDDGIEIEVVQMPLDDWGYVVSHDRTEGRFIVTAKSHLDPLIFRKGREVTVSGVLIGIRTQKLRDKEYEYPLFRAKEVHLLPRTVYYRDPYDGYEPFYYPYRYPYPFIFWPSFYLHYGR